jgi:hypothetical protein
MKPESNIKRLSRCLPRLVREILCAPAPRWMVRLHLRMTARKLHQCADLMLSLGTDEHYKTAVEIRTLAHRVSDSANAATHAPGANEKPLK